MNKDWVEKVKIIKEISKKKAADYIKAASKDIENKSFEHGGKERERVIKRPQKMIPISLVGQNMQYPSQKDKKTKDWDGYDRKMKNRKSGISRAVDKLSSEDYGAGFDGTDELDDKYRKDTPGQSAVLKRIKKIVKERRYGVKSTHLKPRGTTGYTGVPGKNLKGKGNSQKAMSLGIKKVEHAKKDLENN